MSRQIKEPLTDPYFIQRMVNVTPDIIYVMDLGSLELLYCNRPVAEDLGYRADEIMQLKHPMLSLMHKQDRPRMLKHLNDMRTAEDGQIKEIEYRMKHADNTFRWFLDRDSVFKRNETGIATEKIGIAQDITLRKLAQEEVIRQHALQKQSEELALTGSWDYEIATQQFYWSDGMYSLFGIERRSVVQPSIYLEYAVLEDQEIAVKICSCIETSFMPFEETLRIDVGGRVRTILVKAEPGTDEKSIPKQMLGVDMDITRSIEAAGKIRKLNHALKSKNRELESLNTEIKTFASVATINYKAPLATLYTSIEYIIKKDARQLSDSSKANLRKSQGAIQKMKLITEDIINYFGIGMRYSKMSVVNVNQLVRSVLVGLEPRIRNADAKIEVGELPDVQAVLSLMQLLFQYLIENAIKFRRDDVQPVIQIRACTGEGLPGESNNVDGESYIAISIKDNGIGFRPEDQDKLFTMFGKLNDSNKYRGSGIGLAICKKIMEIHKGYIRGEGSPDKGATFTVYFPQ